MTETLVETKIESTERHDEHFLHMMHQAQQALHKHPEDCSFSEPSIYRRKEGKSDLRFTVYFPDKMKGSKSYTTIGVSRITYTHPFNTGYPVLLFFAFYPHKRNPSDGYSSDYLIHSALYIYKSSWWGNKKNPQDCLIPYKRRWYQRLIKKFNDLFYKGSTPLYQFQDLVEKNQEVEEALINTVFAAIHKTGKKDRAFEVVGMRIKE